MGPGHGLHALGRHEADLAGAQLLLKLISQIEEGKALKTDAVRIVLFADLDRGPAQTVAGRVDTVRRHDHHGHGAPDQILGVADALHEGVPLVDQGGGQLRRIDVASAHLQEVGVGTGKELPHEFLGIVDLAHRRDRVGAQMGADDQGLRFIVGDTSDAQLSFHLEDVLVEFRPEIRTLNIVDRPVKALHMVVHCQACAPCSQMGMIVCSVKEVKNTVLLRSNAKKTTHINLLSCLSYKRGSCFPFNMCIISSIRLFCQPERITKSPRLCSSGAKIVYFFGCTLIFRAYWHGLPASRRPQSGPWPSGSTDHGAGLCTAVRLPCRMIMSG